MLSGRKLRQLGQPGVILITAALVLPLLLFALASWQNYRAILEEAKIRAERTVRILEEHALKVLESQRFVVDEINERLPTVDWSREADRAELHELLVKLQTKTDQVTTITITDAAGRMRASGRVYPADPNISFADREWFQTYKKEARDTPFIGKPFIGRQTGHRVFCLAEQVPRDPAGGFNGAIEASIDQAYFEGFYRDVEPEIAHSVTLVRDDGVILAREPATDKTNIASSAEMLHKMQSGSVGSYTGVSPLDGIQRIYAYQKVGPYPVYVRFGVNMRGALAPWFANLATYGLVTAAASLALIAASALAVRQTSREAAARRSWATIAEDLRAEIAQRGRVEDQLRQSQKMEAVGRLTGGVAHDFNNLLTVVIGNLDLVHRRLKAADQRSANMIFNAAEAAKRAASLTHRLLAFSRQQPLEPKRVDVNSLVSGMSDLLRRTLSAEVKIATLFAGELWPTLIDPNQLENAILNLAVNARDAMPAGGTLTIETSNVDADETFGSEHDELTPGPYVLVTVSDTGHGMPPEIVAQVFEPFFTTKPIGKGTGLGLSQVYGFVKQSGGFVSIDSERDIGTTVKLYLPKLQAAEERRTDSLPASIKAPASRRRATILVVEDNKAVCDFTVAALEEAGYDVLEADGGVGALRLLETHPTIALLFTDIILGEPMNGRMLAEAVWRTKPELPVLFTTGYARNAIIHNGRLDEDVNLIGKPFTAADLVLAVDKLLDGEVVQRSALTSMSQ